MSTEQAIRVEDVTRKFGDHTVLDHITLTVERGEIFGLLGPSGSGKTTLVKLIAGIDEADGGEVHICGEKLPKLAMLGRIGYMAQSDALYMELTALENLQFFARLYGLHGSRMKQRIAEATALVNLSAHVKKRVSAYSGGMKRRLSLAIALLHEPEVLILDEPTVGIDPVLRKSIWEELEAVRAAGTTIVVTTHVMDEADKCGRLGMIRDGRLIAVGTPDELKRSSGSDTLEQAFLAYGGAHA